MNAVTPPVLETLHDELHRCYGFAEFRPHQEDAVRAALEGRDVLTVMPTGAGKSLTFQLPAALAAGVTIVISPLIALMRDQVLALRALPAFREIGVAYLNSSQGLDEQREVLSLLRDGRMKLLYVAPERLRSTAFVETLVSVGVERLVVDEAHCISEWGHDFRPDYLAIGGFLEQLGRPPVSAVTATATRRVQASIMEQLSMREPAMMIGGFNRPNLHMAAIRCKSELERDNRLFKALPKLVGRGGSGLIYCSTRKHCERVAALASEALAPLGMKAAIYHAGMDSGTRNAAQEAWLSGHVQLLVATNAFGMGIDKPDVRFVVHYGFPDSPESYYQEAGRAGRDGRRSRCVILSVPAADKKLRQFFIDNEALAASDLEHALRRMAASGEERFTLTREWWDRELGFRDARPRVLLGHMERAGLIERLGETGEGSTLRLLKTAVPVGQLRQLEARLSRARAEKEARLAEMTAYVRTRSCRRRVLLDYFGDEDDVTAEFCCDNCDSGLSTSEAPESDLPDSRVPAPSGIQDIHDLLQALDAMRPAVGRSRLTRLLKGSRAKDTERFLNSPIYNALPAISVEKIGLFLDELVTLGLLHQGDEEEYFVLRITHAGRQAWQKKEPLPVALPGRGAVGLMGAEQVEDALDDEAMLLFERLRTWRRGQAAQENVPAYCVFPDKTLKNIAAQCPKSMEDLAAISGVGGSRQHKYGLDVLEVVARGS